MCRATYTQIPTSLKKVIPTGSLLLMQLDYTTNCLARNFEKYLGNKYSESTTYAIKMEDVSNYVLLYYLVSCCRISEQIGSGLFGRVRLGVWQSPAGAVDVAVKTLRQEATEEDTIRFLQEAASNGQFWHPNVVELRGVVTIGQPVSYSSSDKISAKLYTCIVLV